MAITFSDILKIIPVLAGVVGYFGFSKIAKYRWYCAIYSLLIVASSLVAFHYLNKYNRTQEVERQANLLSQNRRMNYTSEGYIMAALAFLEKNKDLYPDAYRNAMKLCESNDCFSQKYGRNDAVTSLDHGFNMITVASQLDGIVTGIGSLESSKR